MISTNKKFNNLIANLLLLIITAVLNSNGFSSEIVREFPSLRNALKYSYELIGYDNIRDIRPEYHNQKGGINFGPKKVIGISGHLKDMTFFQWRIDFDNNNEDLHINVKVEQQPYALRIKHSSLNWGTGGGNIASIYFSIIEELTGIDISDSNHKTYHYLNDSASARYLVDYIFELAELRDVS